jgi:hypothetical protein
VKETRTKKSFLDYFSLAVTTFGVGYLPLAPGTWGSMVGVGIYLAFRQFSKRMRDLFRRGLDAAQITAWIHAFNLIFSAFLSFGNLGGEPRDEAFQT